MDLSVKDYAAQAGISVPRVHELIRDRKIEARKIGSSWAIPESQLKRRAPLSRPLSLRNSWALIELLSGFQPVAIDATAAWRMRRKCVQIADEADPARLISSWLRSRAPLIALHANPADLQDLRNDPRVMLSGISDERAGLSSSHEVEAYAAPELVDDLRDEYLLVPAERPNVWLHLARVEPDSQGRAPLGLVIADLADHGGPRESARVKELLAQS